MKGQSKRAVTNVFDAFEQKKENLGVNMHYEFPIAKVINADGQISDEDQLMSDYKGSFEKKKYKKPTIYFNTIYAEESIAASSIVVVVPDTDIMIEETDVTNDYGYDFDIYQ